MDNNQYIVALEIGSSKIVGAIAEKSPTGLVSINHLVEEKLLNCVRYGCVQNVENIKSCINRILNNLERSIDGRITQVYVGVSGRSLHSERTVINRSLDSSKPITDEIVKHIIADAAKNPIKGYETIDMVPRSFYVDKNETKNPVGQFGSTIKINVNLLVAKPTLKLNLERVMTGVGFHVKQYMITQLAVGQQVLTESERSLGCMLVDFGAETTDVSIYKDSALVYLTTLPLGSRNITRDIMTGLTVVEETADRVKKNISKPLDPANNDTVVIEGVKSNEAASYIAARTDEIIANINQQLEYAGKNSDDIRSLVLIGGGALLPGLAQRIEEVTKIKVRAGQYPQTLNILNHNINRPEYIEVFSILAKAADEIEPNETCVERHNFDDGPTVTKPVEPAVQPEPNKPEPHKRAGKGWWSRIISKASNLMAEDDEDDDQ